MSYEKVPYSPAPGYPTSAPSAPGFHVDQVHPPYPQPPMGSVSPQPYQMPMPAPQISPYPANQGYPSTHGPVMNQPAPNPSGWMSMPHARTNCPPGLEYLSTIDSLLVHQKVELAEIVLDFETNNKYQIMNGLGQNVYVAAEENDCCTRNCFGSLRPFNLNIMDNFGKQIIRINRPLSCQGCCFPCCLQSVEVSAPPGCVIGSVKQIWSLCQPNFEVRDERGNPILNIRGPLWRTCGDVKFKVYSKDGKTKVGKITKSWTGVLREGLTDSDKFGISFPVDLDVKVKATLLGALFLIDYMYFEN